MEFIQGMDMTFILAEIDEAKTRGDVTQIVSYAGVDYKMDISFGSKVLSVAMNYFGKQRGKQFRAYKENVKSKMRPYLEKYC